VRIGDRIDDFTLLGHDGQPWTLSERVGRPVLLIFHRHLM
jgi:peroxiredoxin